jgi:hypothetical protein
MRSPELHVFILLHDIEKENKDRHTPITSIELQTPDWFLDLYQPMILVVLPSHPVSANLSN